MYDRLWRDWYLPAALPAIQRLFFDQVTSGAKILDVCCGSGHVTAELVMRGFRVTAVDSSAELIELARAHVQGAEFLVQDVRTLRLPLVFDAAISTFDSLNHLLAIEDLRAALLSIGQALKPNGLFVFDMNLEEAYTLDLQQWHATVEENSVGLVRGNFNPVSKEAETELLWFIRKADETWLRQTSIIRQRCYSQSEIVSAFADAGFSRIEVISARDAGVTADLGFGRIFVSGRRKQ
jgi:SAM-dependent methyltransferase